MGQADFLDKHGGTLAQVSGNVRRPTAKEVGMGNPAEKTIGRPTSTRFSEVRAGVKPYI
jgi:hypothetical protein